MENISVVKRNKKSNALGDDPLAWIASDDGLVKSKEIKVTAAKKAQPAKNEKDKKQVKRMTAKKERENKRTDKKSSDVNKLVLDPIITINDAQKMYRQLGLLLELKQDITIDASAVEMLDTAVLQLLLAFVNNIKAQSNEVVWLQPSEEMINRVTTLNLQVDLSLDGII